MASYFGVFPPGEPFAPNDDARPSQNLPIILDNEPKQMVMGHWGYPIHVDGKDRELVNIRAESIMEKPFFQRAVKNHRCIILADGFFEWKKIGGNKKEKYKFALDKRPMAFAGVYQWKTKKLSDEMRPFFSIITVPANKTMTPIHDRMPVILPTGKEKEWITGDLALDLLLPYRSKLVTAAV